MTVIQKYFNAILFSTIIMLFAYGCSQEKKPAFTKSEQIRLNYLESLIRSRTPGAIDSIIRQKQKKINKLNQ